MIDISQSLPLAIIVEPNSLLQSPYNFMQSAFTIDRHISIQNALHSIAHNQPAMVSVSASFSPQQCLHILTAVKNKSHNQLIPLLIVIDLSNKMSMVPGTTWGNKLGVITSISDINEYNSTIDRITHNL